MAQRSLIAEMSPAEPNPLQEKIIRLIKAGGPIPLADYMHLCLADPEHGYYKTKQAIGPSGKNGKTGGDFITAPEISQMFGELIGIWCATAWQALGSPDQFTLAEIGPGKGTLMADLLRAAKQVPGFLSSADLRLIETSERLSEQQGTAIAQYQSDLRSFQAISSIDELPKQPMILIANEFLDAVPFRQYVKSENNWHEVGVNVDENGNLQRGRIATKLEGRLLPEGAEKEVDGAVFELAPAREAVVETLASHIAEQGGAALLIDYGHLHSGFGDTFQAVSNHQYSDPFAAPGEADLTSHVDFERLEKTAQSLKGVSTATTTQANFLLEMGLLERAGTLGRNKSSQEKTIIHSQVERLAAPDQMGDLFKVMGIFPSTLRLPGFSK